MGDSVDEIPEQFPSYGGNKGLRRKKRTHSQFQRWLYLQLPLEAGYNTQETTLIKWIKGI